MALCMNPGDSRYRPVYVYALCARSCMGMRDLRLDLLIGAGFERGGAVARPIMRAAHAPFPARSAPLTLPLLSRSAAFRIAHTPLTCRLHRLSRALTPLCSAHTALRQARKRRFHLSTDRRSNLSLCLCVLASALSRLCLHRGRPGPRRARYLT